jgi:DNA-binding transcriptional LysR family regulator
MRSAPAMTGLRALEAVIRTGSLSAASRELCVTPAAISHRLRELEARCGAPLVYRSGGRFEATEMGRAVAVALGDAFQRIRLADDYLSRGSARELRITASYSFAVLWLTPRIPLLEKEFPETDLVINPTHDPLGHAASDVTILHATQCPEGYAWVRLFQDRCAAVARAEHPYFDEEPQRLQQVLNSRLLHIAHGKGRNWGEYSWGDWAAHHGLMLPEVWTKGPSVSAEHLAVEMLQTSNIFALVSVINASVFLATNRLKAVPSSEVPTGCSYWISHRDEAGPRSNRAKQFVDFMVANLTA